jgi:quercetin dioxygenase-like cupin family protein
MRVGRGSGKAFPRRDAVDGLEANMQKVVVKRFETPDDRREFPRGLFELLKLAGLEVGRARYEPGWRWSEHVGPIAGTRSCEVEHVGIVISGRAAVLMDDGAETILQAGDAFYVPPGHDSWVVGGEPYVSLHLQGASRYATAHQAAAGRRAAKASARRRPPAGASRATRAGARARTVRPRRPRRKQ